MSVYAVLLCGGSGSRMGAAGNKTLLPVGGVPAVVRALRVFAKATEGCVLVVRAGEETIFRETLRACALPDFPIVPGGCDRQESCLRGLEALPEACDIVLIHDGARPFVTERIIADAIASVRARGSGVAAIPARDTVKRAAVDGRVLETLRRSELYQMQTPQGFYRRDLLAAHRRAAARYTDDAALMEAAGFPVYLTPGSPDNLKLTSPEDLRMAGGLFLPRIGYGFDVHRLVSGRALVLGGVSVPYEKGLLGHSDADVALHALMDALLGAAAMPDIGRLFPDNDARYAGISSLTLLEEVGKRLRAAGYEIGNADVTIVAQAPKLAPYMDDMRAATAAALQAPPERIGFKATTTERMGFEGEGLGVSAHAVALLYGMA